MYEKISGWLGKIGIVLCFVGLVFSESKIIAVTIPVFLIIFACVNLFLMKRFEMQNKREKRISLILLAAGIFLLGGELSVRL